MNLLLGDSRQTQQRQRAAQQMYVCLHVTPTAAAASKKEKQTDKAERPLLLTVPARYERRCHPKRIAPQPQSDTAPMYRSHSVCCLALL